MRAHGQLRNAPAGPAKRGAERPAGSLDNRDRKIRDGVSVGGDRAGDRRARETGRQRQTEEPGSE